MSGLMLRFWLVLVLLRLFLLKVLLWLLLKLYLLLFMLGLVRDELLVVKKRCWCRCGLLRLCMILNDVLGAELRLRLRLLLLLWLWLLNHDVHRIRCFLELLVGDWRFGRLWDNTARVFDLFEKVLVILTGCDLPLGCELDFFLIGNI
jgi:hypothetical protein